MYYKYFSDDDVTIPIESQTEIMVPSDVVSETVVVTTTPYRKAMTGHVTTKESLPLTHDVCGTGEVVGESDGNFLPMQHDFSATNRSVELIIYDTIFSPSSLWQKNVHKYWLTT